MGFADWKKRSEACANVLTYSMPTRSNVLRALQAAYKAGEREGRKQVEAVAENGAKLAVLVERETCAKICDDRAAICEARSEKTDDEDDRTELKANAWQFSVLAAEIRKTPNAKVRGGSDSDRPA